MHQPSSSVHCTFLIPDPIKQFGPIVLGDGQIYGLKNMREYRPDFSSSGGHGKNKFPTSANNANQLECNKSRKVI